MTLRPPLRTCCTCMHQVQQARMPSLLHKCQWKSLSVVYHSLKYSRAHGAIGLALRCGSELYVWQAVYFVVPTKPCGTPIDETRGISQASKHDQICAPDDFHTSIDVDCASSFTTRRFADPACVGCLAYVCRSQHSGPRKPA